MGAYRWGLMVLIAVWIAACNPFARDASSDAEARAVFDQIRHHQDDAFTASLDPRLRTPEAQAQLAAIQRLLPDGEPGSRTIVATNTVIFNGARTVSTTDEYDYGDRSVLVQIRMQGRGSEPEWLVQGFHVNVVSSAQLAANDFTLVGKGFLQYLFLAAMVGVPAIMLAAAVKVLRASGLRRKWLWIAIACFGVCGATMNWTTGAVSLKLLSVQVLGSGFMRGSSRFAPWLLTTSLPVGAVLILAGIWGNPRRAVRKC
jgi:hypothetical protein